MFKGVWAANLKADEVDTAIEETIAWFKDRKAPFFFWWTGPGTAPDDLGQRLQAHGLTDMAEQMEELAKGIKQTAAGAPCMVADLFQMNEQVLHQTPPGFFIQEVDDEAGLQDFKKVFVETYEIPEWAGQAWVDATQSIGIGRTPWRIFVGYLEGAPVATNMLYNGAGVAGLFAVATLPSARSQGIGAAITLKPLLLAREEGYRHGVLFSTEMGVRVYKRIGFHLTDARINRYLWRDI
jgi:GNAT superfamily N-acetyltransferase